MSDVMDPILTRAQADHAERVERIERLERDLATARVDAEEIAVFIRRYQRYADGRQGEAQSPEASDTQPTRRPLRQGSTGARMADVAVEAIIREGRALSINELLEAVRSAGFQINGERPTTNLSSVLSRSERIVYVRKVGWRLTSEEPSPDNASDTETASPEMEDAA